MLRRKSKTLIIDRPGGWQGWIDETPIRRHPLAGAVSGIVLFVIGGGLLCAGLAASFIGGASSPDLVAATAAPYVYRGAGYDIGRLATLPARLLPMGKPGAAIPVTPNTTIAPATNTPSMAAPTPEAAVTVIREVATVIVTAPPRVDQVVITAPPQVYITQIPPVTVIVTPTPNGLRGAN